MRITKTFYGEHKMSMGQIAKSLKASRTSMMEVEMDEAAESFRSYFGMRDGDYIEFERGNANPWRVIGRILSVDDVYWNAAGGLTANVRVVPLNRNGKLGQTVTVTMCVNANGTGLRGVGNRHLVRLSKSREYV